MLLTRDEARDLTFRAASVHERHAMLDGGPAASPPGDEERLATLCRTWIQAFAPGDPEAFERRLAWDELDLDALRPVVADPGALGGAIAADLWTEWLSDVLERAPAVVREIATTGAVREAALFPEGDEPPFIDLLAPFVRAAEARLAARCPSWSPAADGVRQAFVRQLVKDLAGFSELTLLRQFQAVRAARVADAARPTSPDAAYRAFVLAHLRGGLVLLWSGYPVLARHFATVLETWTVSTAEFFDRLEADASALAEAFGPLGPLVAVRPALSDPHNGRRRVAFAEFESGTTLVYKPRDVGLEEAFFAFVRWANAAGLTPAQPTLTTVSRPEYGWSERAVPAVFDSTDGVRRYYRAGGGLLALAYALRGRDLQMENIVAASGGPTLIDAEMLLQPVPDKDLDADARPRADTCLASGLLTLAHAGPGDLVYDIGGIRGDGLTPTSLSRRVWTGLRTDGIAYRDERVVTQATPNRVFLGGELQSPEPFAESIVEGFTSTYRFLLANRAALASPEGPLRSFRGCAVRVVFRPSQHYAGAQYALAAPAYQGSGASRTCALDTLNRVFNRDQRRPPLWPVIDDERRSLDGLDIPRYWVRSEDTIVESHHGPLEGDYFARPGLWAVEAVIDRLSESDLERQCHIVRTSLANGVGRRLETPLPDPDEAPDSGAGRAVFARHAEALADEVLRRAIERDGALRWIEQQAKGGVWERQVLYDGAVGTAVLFAALASTTGHERFARGARAAATDLLALIAARPEEGVGEVGLGGCTGVGSLFYGLTLVGVLLDDERPLDAAERLAGALPAAAIDADRKFDVTSGAAGCVLGLLALHRRRPDPRWLSLAGRCGDRLIAAQESMPQGAAWPVRRGRPLAGFAHGSAGIAYALLHLAARTGEDRFVAPAARAIAYERTLFAPGVGNWPVIGSLDARTGSGHTTMTAWCHGAPGIAVSRAFAPRELRDAECDREIEVALKTTATTPVGVLDQICCGTLGRSDVLQGVGAALGRPDAVEAGVDLARRAAARASRRQLYGLRGSGVDYRVFDPGLFRGLAGIGYVLLRTAFPGRLPSVLAYQMDHGPEPATKGSAHERA
jgi:type 2 lantibiotic biosynthesis protein LanM